MNIDNQQANSSFRLGWLIGIMDGEGCFTFNICHGRSKDLNTVYKPLITMSTTSLKIRDYFIQVMNEYDLPYLIYFRERKSSQHKNQWMMIIRGMKRGKRFLEIVKDLLVDKKEQANILWRFISYRETKSSRDTYTDIEEKMYWEIRKLNQRGKASTTTIPTDGNI